MKPNDKIPIQQAVLLLKKQMNTIQTVRNWAEVMGYGNVSQFSIQFRNHYGQRPKKVMDKIKLTVAIDLLTSNRNQSCYEIANVIGKKDEHSLYQFIKRMTGHPPTYFRNHK